MPKVLSLPLSQEKLEAVRATADARLGELGTGVERLRALGPGYARLVRWRLGRIWSRTRAGSSASLWFSVLLGLSTSFACTVLDPEGGLGTFSPELAKTKKAERERTRWSYVLPIDHGVRADDEGQGYFRAPRFHGEHNGIDLLAPVGTTTFSACEGLAIASVSGSFGKMVHLVCPIPAEFSESEGPEPWASFLYAHLDKLDIPLDVWTPVKSGEAIGAVGKTGNARGSNVQPHLHLELIVQRNRRSAMDEMHLGKDQSNVRAAESFARALERTCLEPHGFQPKKAEIARARRLDPFVVLTCLSREKPNYKKAPSPLDLASNAWSEFYVAKKFDVDRGPDDGRRR